MTRGPMRRLDDHVHPEYWLREDQRDYDSRVGREIKGLREDVESLTTRILLLFGGLAVLGFVIGPIIGPLIRSWLQLP